MALCCRSCTWQSRQAHPARDASPAGFLTGTQQLGGTKKLKQHGRDGGSSLDQGTVFVAGATGRLGARIVRELLAQGYRVRAGVRSAKKAESHIKNATSYGLLSQEELGRLSVVLCDLENPDTIRPAIGRAAKVVCAVGASESELGDISAPSRIDGAGTTRLVEAATAAGVEQFVLVTSLGTGKIGFPAGILNLFGGVLLFKRQAEEALEASGLPYVIVRPGGMEAPRDDFKRTHNLRLATRDKLFNGLVSRLQVAELVAAAVDNPALAQNKVLEVVAETTAPALSYKDLLAAHPEEQSQDERDAQRAARVQLLAWLEEARGALAGAEARFAQAREVAAAATGRAGAAREAEAAVRKEQAAVLKEAEAAEKQLAALVAAAEKRTLVATAAKAALSAAQAAARDNRVLTPKEVAAVKAGVLAPPKPAAALAPAPRRAEGGTTVLGGLFGTQRKEAPAREPEAEAVVEAERGGLFGGLFGPPKVVADIKAAVEEEEPEEEVVEAPEGPGLLSGLFGFGARTGSILQAADREEKEKEEAPAPAPAPAKPAPGSVFGLGGGAPKPSTAAAAESKAAAAAAQREAAEAKRQAERNSALKAAAAAEEERKAAERAAAAAAVAKDAEVKKAAEAAAIAAAAKQVEEEEEARAAAAAAADLVARRAAAAEAARRAEAEALARMEAEAAAKKAEEAAKRAAKKAAEEAAARKATAASAPKPAAAVPTAVPITKPAPVAAAVAPSGEVPANVVSARAWIADWRARGSAAAPAAAPAADVPPNVAEARAWIQAWKARS
eukprot:scaffold11.g3986.t1